MHTRLWRSQWTTVPLWWVPNAVVTLNLHDKGIKKYLYHWLPDDWRAGFNKRQDDSCTSLQSCLPLLGGTAFCWLLIVLSCTGGQNLGTAMCWWAAPPFWICSLRHGSTTVVLHLCCINIHAVPQECSTQLIISISTALVWWDPLPGATLGVLLSAQSRFSRACWACWPLQNTSPEMFPPAAQWGSISLKCYLLSLCCCQSGCVQSLCPGLHSSCQTCRLFSAFPLIPIIKNPADAKIASPGELIFAQQSLSL